MASPTNCLRTVLFLLHATLERWVPVRRWHMAHFLLRVTPARWVPARRWHMVHFLLLVTPARWVPGLLMVRFLLHVTPARWVPGLHVRWSVCKHNLNFFRLMIPGDRVLKLEPGNVT
jgi:hypothetical protein